MHGILWTYKGVVAVGSEGNVVTSQDGFVWATENYATYNDIKDIIWDGYKYIAVGSKGTILYGTGDSNPDM